MRLLCSHLDSIVMFQFNRSNAIPNSSLCCLRPHRSTLYMFYSFLLLLLFFAAFANAVIVCVCVFFFTWRTSDLVWMLKLFKLKIYSLIIYSWFILLSFSHSNSHSHSQWIMVARATSMWYWLVDFPIFLRVSVCGTEKKTTLFWYRYLEHQ